MKMNLEQTVQYLLDCIETGIKIEEFFTDRAMLQLKTLDEENVGKYYLLKEGLTPIHLFIVTKLNGVRTLQDLGEWPKPGIQGVAGPTGPAPEIKISAQGTWVINGVDTGKPSRGIKGEEGHTGMQGRPGAGAGSVTAVDGTDYDITVSEGEDYDLITTITEIHYYDDDEEKTDEVALKYYVPHKASVAEYFEVTAGKIQPTKDMKIPTGKNLFVTNFGQIKNSNNETILNTFIDKQNGIVCSKNTFTSLDSVVPVISRVSGSQANVINTLKATSSVVGEALVTRTLAGSISVPEQPNGNNSAVSKKYVDDAVAGAAGGATIIECTHAYSQDAGGNIPTPTLAQCQEIISLFSQGKVVYLSWDEDSDCYGAVIECDYNDTFTVAIYGSHFVTYTYSEPDEVVNTVRYAMSKEEMPTPTPLYKHSIRLVRNAGETDTPATIYLQMICYRSSTIRSVAQFIAGLQSGYLSLYCMRYTDAGPIEQSFVWPSWVEGNNTLRLRYMLPGNEYINVLPIQKYTWQADTMTVIN